MSISYSKAIEHFSQVAYPPRVTALVTNFRALKDRGVIYGYERDIGYWMRKGIGEFARFVDRAMVRVSKRDIKRANKSESIKLIDTPTVKLVIPLSMEAAKLYGKGTVWCTTSRNAEANRFINFFYCGNVTSVILYWINTETDARIGMLYEKHSDGFHITYYDGFNNVVTATAFENLTGITESEIVASVQQHSETIDFARLMPDAVQERVGLELGEASVRLLDERAAYYECQLDLFVDRVRATSNRKFVGFEEESTLKSSMPGLKGDLRIMRNTLRTLANNHKLNNFRALVVAHPIMVEIVTASKAYSRLMLMESRLDAIEAEIEYLESQIKPSLPSLNSIESFAMDTSLYAAGLNRGISSIRTTASQVRTQTVATAADAAFPRGNVYEEMVQQIRQAMMENIERAYLDMLIPTASSEATQNTIRIYRSPQQNGP